MKSVWLRFKQINTGKSLLLLYDEMVIFQRPDLIKYGKQQSHDRFELEKITMTIYQFTETLFFESADSELFKQKLDSIISISQKLNLSKQAVIDLFKIWIMILGEEFKRNWSSVSEKIIKAKLVEIMAYFDENF